MSAIKRLSVATVVSLSLSLLTIGEAEALTFTKVADTSGGFSGLGAPVINDAGIVAFYATLDAGGSGIFTSNGTTIEERIDSTAN